MRITASRIVSLLFLETFRWPVSSETDNTLADTWDFGKELASKAVLKPLQQEFSFAAAVPPPENPAKFNSTLCNTWSHWDFVTYVCGGSGLLVVWNGPVGIELSNDSLAVDWRYWLEPAELKLKVVLKYRVLGGTSDSSTNSYAMDGTVNGTIVLYIRTEFGLCLLNTEFNIYEAAIETAREDVPTGKALRALVDEPLTTSIEDCLSQLLIIPDFCNKWLPSSYFSIMKY